MEEKHLIVDPDSDNNSKVFLQPGLGDQKVEKHWFTPVLKITNLAKHMIIKVIFEAQKEIPLNINGSRPTRWETQI